MSYRANGLENVCVFSFSPSKWSVADKNIITGFSFAKYALIAPPTVKKSIEF